ncbi:sigma-54-dependent transcriptional regulator [Gynurincola endophyticus]|uniref:sigma-54-dependent transcriptional regulator n=1 Tax=Gynurincola endophyticus TaxID=2479004 RepID=UPI000F8D34FC|nr:sigma-54 dependent transcriptional regulator [Gynurincola endophyticus]
MSLKLLPQPLKIFILDDDAFFVKALAHFLNLNPDNTVKPFLDAKSLFANIHEQPDVITLDYQMPGMDGAQVLKKIRSINENIKVIVISSQEKVKVAVELLNNGAYDYLVKGEDPTETHTLLWDLLTKIANAKRLEARVEELQEQVAQRYDYSKFLIGKDASIATIYSLIEKACKTNITVSITGETGTGKEMVAKAIHYNSERKKAPFVAVNVAAIPKELIESELFGYEKGAFTGAHSRRIGKFEEANGGTLFLDEIGELELSLQAKLLRIVQEREVSRIGGNEIVPLNIRIIVATHKNLLEEAKKKTFREDLYYRLMGLPIQLPPLRDRGNDVILLALHFTDLFVKENKLPKKTLSQDARQKLLKHPFPGNVRELKSVMELACVMSDDLNTIDAEHITLYNTSTIDDLLNQERTLKEYEHQIIQYFLDKYNNDVLLVAKKLDVGKSTLYRMIQAGELKVK